MRIFLAHAFVHFSCPDTVIMRGRGSGGAISAATLMHLEFSYLYKRNHFRFDPPNFVCLRYRRRGFAGGMSAFLNGHFLGSAEGTAHSQDGIDVLNVTYTFNTAHLVSGDNGQCQRILLERLGTQSFPVLTIYHDSTGMNQDCKLRSVSLELSRANMLDQMVSTTSTRY